MDESELDRFGDEWLRFLNELRIVLPGVQLLFGFLFSVPFTARFDALGFMERRVYFICFLCTFAACAFLVAPAVYHRLHWRRDVRDKEQMMRTCNRLAIVGGLFLAIAMTLAVWVLTALISDPWLSVTTTTLAAVMLGTLWFGLPLSRRVMEKRK
jgi:Family of unknown function (DUF6328)